MGATILIINRCICFRKKNADQQTFFWGTYLGGGEQKLKMEEGVKDAMKTGRREQRQRGHKGLRVEKQKLVG